MTNAARVIGVALFFAVLFVVDRALAQWGSATIRRRPRSGLRVTVVFVTVVASYSLFAFAARSAATWSSAFGWVVLALAFPACSASALAVDRLLPEVTPG